MLDMLIEDNRIFMIKLLRGTDYGISTDDAAKYMKNLNKQEEVGLPFIGDINDVKVSILRNTTNRKWARTYAIENDLIT